jgi:hypothetical protein
MKSKEKIEFIQLALENADQLISSLPAEQYQVPALTSLRIRHLLNSLGKLGTRYLEVGVHRGGTFTASVGGNVNLETATAIDSFESDVTANEGAKDDFLHWSCRFLPGSTIQKFLKKSLPTLICICMTETIVKKAKKEH